MVQVHLNAMDSQMRDMWHGLALAALLNRTLILPKVRRSGDRALLGVLQRRMGME